MDYSPQGWEKKIPPAGREKNRIYGLQPAGLGERKARASGEKTHRTKKRYHRKDFQDSLGPFKKAAKKFPRFPGFPSVARGDERTAAGDRKENWIYGLQPAGLGEEKPARWERKGMDLWITARRAGRKKSPRQRREHRRRGETAGGAPDGAPPRCSFYAEKNYFNSTVARRFLARPSLVLLSATGSLGPLLSQTMLAAGAPRFTM